MFGRLFVLCAATVATTSPSVVWAQGLVRGGTAASLAGGVGSAPGAGSIRASDDDMVTLLSDGTKRSETLRMLGERIAKSDVIVYIRPDVTTKGRVGNQGRLTFISSRGGYRYLVIHIPSAMARQQQLAILAHELQHAVSIADAPAVVDSQSLRAEFERIGNVSQGSSTRDMAFDSPAAVEVKRRVLREVAAN